MDSTMVHWGRLAIRLLPARTGGWLNGNVTPATDESTTPSAERRGHDCAPDLGAALSATAA